MTSDKRVRLHLLRPFVALLCTRMLSSCHQTPRTVATPVVAPDAHHCWWAVVRSAQPRDTVAARFQRALASLGATNVTRIDVADTTRIHAGPTAWMRGARSGSSESWVIAYQRPDSTHFRVFVALAPSGDGSNPPDTGDSIALCGDINRVAAVGGWAPREPDGEEKLDVWRLQP